MSTVPESPPIGRVDPAATFETLVDPAAVCPIRLPAFEGPLDLLMSLIRQQELDITDLPVARIAEQYLSYLALMQDLHLDVAAEYLVMAATLAWIKSRMLLPLDDVDEDEEAGDPRAELVARLLEYQRFQEAAEDLGSRSLLGRDVFTVVPEPQEAPPEGEREIEAGLFELLDALRRVLADAPEEASIHQIVTEPVTVRERMIAVMEALERADTLEFERVFRPADGSPPTRGLIVATFLAILELAKISALRIFQSLNDGGAPEGPIRLRRAQIALGALAALTASDVGALPVEADDPDESGALDPSDETIGE